jgi:lipopolysaccharide transport system ATP-binding protein
MPTSIKIQNLSKQYRLGVVGTGTLSHDLKRWWATSIRGKEDPYLKIGETNVIATRNPACPAEHSGNGKLETRNS